MHVIICMQEALKETKYRDNMATTLINRSPLIEVHPDARSIYKPTTIHFREVHVIVIHY